MYTQRELGKRFKRGFLLSTLLLSGCSNLFSGVASQLADGLSESILSSSDIETVREGVPAFLLLIDGLLKSGAETTELLVSAADLNGSFSVLVEDKDRLKMLSAKAMRYSDQAACVASSSRSRRRAAGPFGRRDAQSLYAVAPTESGRDRIKRRGSGWEGCTARTDLCPHLHGSGASTPVKNQQNI